MFEVVATAFQFMWRSKMTSADRGPLENTYEDEPKFVGYNFDSAKEQVQLAMVRKKNRRMRLFWCYEQ
ncbi:hypothetical protein Q1695_000217 [Nippostrongylus brasiliensis]|nr:hypothetical protein Q1695_000217 [Nippostrongylus brasiliensis]